MPIIARKLHFDTVLLLAKRNRPEVPCAPPLEGADAFDHAWVFMIIACGLAAAAALSIGPVGARTPAPAVAEPAAG
jgi:hypothetical protein